MFHVKHNCGKDYFPGNNNDIMDNIERYLSILYKMAIKSYKYGEVPVGAIVIYNNKVIGKGFNTKERDNDVCGHAEVMAIKQACHKLKDWRLNDVILLTTLKPCCMCNEIIKASRIGKVYYILDQNNINYDSNYIKLEVSNDYYIKYEYLLDNFFKEMR